MVSRRAVSFLLVSLMMIGVASRAAAQDAFREGAIGVEFGGAAMGELWNLNDRREWLAGGSAAVWWNFTRRATLEIGRASCGGFKP